MGKPLSRKVDARPAFSWYPKDWLAADGGLRSCSYAARGLWADLLCVAWNATTRGALCPDARKLARMTGGECAEVMALLVELHEARVFSWLADGVIVKDARPVWRLSDGTPNPEPVPGALICCRRMYREHCTSAARRDAGRVGGLASGRSRNKEQGSFEANRNEQASKTPAKPQAKRKQSEPHKAAEILDLMRVASSKQESKTAAKLNPSDLRSPISDLLDRSIADLNVGNGGDRIGDFRKDDIHGASAGALAQIAIALDGRNCPDKAREYWQARFDGIAARGGLEWLRGRFLHLWHAAHPEAGGGVGPIRNPAAWLNQETAKYGKVES